MVNAPEDYYAAGKSDNHLISYKYDRSLKKSRVEKESEVSSKKIGQKKHLHTR